MATQLTKVVANFETSIASKLAFSATTGSLTSAVDKNGVALPTGKYCMIADRGTGDEEHLLFDLTGTAMTNIVSISRQGVSTAGVQNANGHRAGSKCYLTDFVNLKTIVDILNGVDTLDAENPLKYGADPTYTDDKQLIAKKYVDVFLADKASVSGNNNFAGNNSFALSPSIPDAITSSQPVTLAQLLAAVFIGIPAGFENVDVSRELSGRVISLHDNINGKTYVFDYDYNDQICAIFDGSRRTVLTTVDGQFISKVTN